jgi:transcriptional regulator with PAS, ATPase and Fis domain
MPTPNNPVLPLKDVARDAARRHISTVLTLVNWNKSKAARVLNVSRPTLYGKLRALEIGR